MHWKFAVLIALSSLITFLFPSDDSVITKQNMNEIENRKPNRLINERSPYLLQHAYNPVDWYPWGDEAFEKARSEDKPIFLSVGYSTCYWCHVMEREVFENDSIAELMNKYLVSIKVDREERPDVDRVYMSALQSMTGSGGWPMSMFLTPDLKPFYGATYVPPRVKYGRGGFEDLVSEINEAWHNRRNEILKAGDEIISFLKSRDLVTSDKEQGTPSEEVIKKCYDEFARRFDPDYGGFDGAPKFPRPSGFNFLLRYHYRFGEKEALSIVEKTLIEMAKGGIYDQLGGGFHRYSVDGYWRVPHFEKMLYDQAQLANVYMDAYQITKNLSPQDLSGDEFYANVAKDILNYVLRKLTHKEGGFYSAEDAESALDPAKPDEKEEGAFYVWEKSEIDKLLGPQNSGIFCYHFDVGERGNVPAGSDPHNVFIDKNILYANRSISETANKVGISTDKVREIIINSKKILFDVRERRPHPHLDDKILVSWNGLMVSAFARAYRIFNDKRYLDAAEKSARFILSNLYNSENNTLLHRFRSGEARFEGTLDDYAFFTQGLLDLYESSFDKHYLEMAVKLVTAMLSMFWDDETGGFFDVSANDKSILVRTKEYYDSAEPSGNSIAVMDLLRVSQFTDNRELHDKAAKIFSAFSSIISLQPYAVPQMLCALDFYLHSPKEIIIAGKSGSNDVEMMLREVHKYFIPDKILIFAESGKQNKLIPYLQTIVSSSDKATAYVCENYTCKLPTSDLIQFSKLLQGK